MMGWIWVDTFWGTIAKYTTATLIAGSIGYYKGCNTGREIERRNCTEMTYEYSIQNSIQKNNLEQLLGGRK